MVKDNRKQTLFDKFANQLTLLKGNGLIDIDLKFDKTYICPLCLNQFSEADLIANKSKNYLTEEDAPPASLGGLRIALTCKKCNSKCGHNIDYQLKELIEHEENSKFIKGTVQRGTIEFNGTPITVEMTSHGNKTLQAVHDEKRNNPSVFKKFINSVKKGAIITFSKFGYIFLLDRAYDKIREQILNPDKEIINFNLAIHNAHLKDHIGTHYILDKGIKAIFNIFNLKSKLTEKPYGAFLPIPIISIKTFVTEMEKRIVNNVAVFNKSIYNDNADLFNDIEEIRKKKKWTENNN